MVEVAVWAAGMLAAATAVFVVVLSVRWVQLARAERAERGAEERLRPVALALLDGEPPRAGLSPRDARVLASLLGRYALHVSGDVRGRLAAFFEEHGDVERAQRELGDRRAWRRAAAAHELGDYGSPRAVPWLLDALHDPAREVRAAAARSLGRLGGTEAVEPLAVAFASRAVPRAVAGHALLTLGVVALPALRRLEARAEAEVRLAAVELVGLLGDASEARLLVERLRDTSAEVRATAARALGRVGADEAAAELRATLHDRIPFVRAAAASALGAVGDRDDVAALLLAARDPHYEAARAAARAAALVDPERVREEAKRKDAGPHLREAADVAASRAP